MKGIKDYYNDTVDMWTDEWYENTTMLPFLEKVVELLPSGAKVLDLGCNSGYETRRMKKLGLEVVGLDFSDKSIELAKKLNPNIEFICDDMLNDLTYLGKFDGVVAIASIIHIPQEKLSLCFERIYDILSNNGILAMVFRSEEGKLEASNRNVNDKEYDREVYGYLKDSLEKEMNNKFEFVEEMKAHDEHWKYYFYRKV